MMFPLPHSREIKMNVVRQVGFHFLFMESFKSLLVLIFTYNHVILCFIFFYSPMTEWRRGIALRGYRTVGEKISHLFPAVDEGLTFLVKDLNG